MLWWAERKVSDPWNRLFRWHPRWKYDLPELRDKTFQSKNKFFTLKWTNQLLRQCWYCYFPLVFCIYKVMHNDESVQWPSKFPTLANVIFGKHDEVWWLSRKCFLAMWQLLLVVQQMRFGYVTNNCWLYGKYFLALWQIWRISEQQAAPNVRPCVSGGVQIPAPHSHVCPAVLSSFVTPYTLHAFAHTEYFPRLYSVILVRIIRTLACSSLFGAKSAICRRVTSHARESQYVRCSETSDTKVHPSI